MAHCPLTPAEAESLALDGRQVDHGARAWALVARLNLLKGLAWAPLAAARRESSAPGAMPRIQELAFVMACGVSLSLVPTLGGLARPNPGGLGGPDSGAGVAPGAGFGAAGAGLDREPGVGAPGVGVEDRPVENPGGLGGPASGAGVRPGAGFGAPGAGLYR